MATEALTLPVFETARGELISDVDPGISLRYGFLLREVEKPKFGELHQMHTQVAQDMLVSHLEVDSRSRARVAIPNLPMRKATPRHLDGVVGRYFQVITCHDERGAGGTNLRLSVYPADEALHAYFTDLAEFMDPSSALEETLFADGDMSGFYPYSYANMLPDSPSRTYDAVAMPGTSAVFSNGYPALSSCIPEEVILHEASGVDNPTALRVLSLSTIM